MQKPETVFRKKVDKLLAKIPNSWWESIQQKSIVGTPDKIGCVNGLFVAIEFKKDAKSKLTKMQEYKKIGIEKTAKGVHIVMYPENMEKELERLRYFSTLDYIILRQGELNGN